MSKNRNSSKLTTVGNNRKANMLCELQSVVTELPARRLKRRRRRRVAVWCATICSAVCLVALLLIQMPKDPAPDSIAKDSKTVKPQLLVDAANGNSHVVAGKPTIGMPIVSTVSNRTSVISEYVVRNRPLSQLNIETITEPRTEYSLNQQLREAGSDMFLAEIDNRLVVLQPDPQRAKPFNEPLN